MKVCQGCRKRITAPGFCIECRAALKAPQNLDSSGNLNLKALFHYCQTIRHTIMRAKIKNDPHALAGLSALFSGHEDVLNAVAHCEVIVPAPSSLWGRCRGRFDVAQAMALSLADEVGKPIRLLPLRYYMSLGKRAGKNQSSVKVSEVKPKLCRQDFLGLNVLLVDDVMTTGVTMQKTIQIVLDGGAKRVFAVALAASNDIIKS